MLRGSTTYCPEVSSGTQRLPDQVVNGRTVHVTCQALSGSAGGGGGGGGASDYSVVVTGYPGPTGSSPNLTDAITTKNSSQKGDLHFVGPAFNAGGFSYSGGYDPRLVFDHDLHEYDSTTPWCTNAKAAAVSSDNPHVNGTWTCEQPGTYPVPDPLPTLKVPTATRPAPYTSGGCTILFPGKYTSRPTFSSSGKYYFASGVYYFHNVGTITLNGQVFGGAPGSESQLFTGITPCANDAAANARVPGSATGSGVEFVLGGNSRITLGNSTSNKVELFSRAPANPDAEGTPGVSIYAPRTAGSGYSAWNTTSALDLPRAKPQIVIHGLVYTPNSPLTVLIVTNPSAANAAMFQGGLVVQVLAIKSTGSNPFTNLGFASVALPDPPTPRTVVVTATADATNPGEPPTVVKAVVLLPVSPSTPPTVLSWRKA